jgi:hypothetical protein
MASRTSENYIELQVGSKRGPSQTIVALKDASQEGNAITRESLKALGFSRWSISITDGMIWKIKLTWTCRSVSASVRQNFQIKKTLPAAIVLGRKACHMLEDAVRRGDEEREVLPITPVHMTERTGLPLPTGPPIADEAVEERADHEAREKRKRDEKAKREQAKIADLEKGQGSKAAPDRSQG